ncbi:hypothetical protein Moror_17039 [Moniliophthora roreri MCA 2997]|uniref:F-box domain-containing protein n=1 Tax=Moniliophthora roreri (strain MCA 2997) TaxID=1381753 RepID=V2X4X4_MONRO|nr:hypothetical protein Moror_17039 [Moniliophthora roreri MCA 2997]
MAAIDRLPPEIMLTIFSLANSPQGTDEIQPMMAWNIGQVSSRWLNLARNAPELWTSITLDRTKMSDPVHWEQLADTLEEIFRRARKQPLSIKLRDLPKPDGDHYAHWIFESVYEFILNGQGPRIVKPIVPWDQISSLDLSHFHPSHALHLLSRCVRVESLTLTHWATAKYSYMPISGWDHVKVNSLRKLRISAELDGLLSVIRYLMVPNLERLELFEVVAGQATFFEPTLELIRRSECKLKAIHFDNICGDPAAIRKALAVAPDATELVLEGDILDHIIDNIAQSGRLPKLEHLIVRCTPCTKSAAGIPPPLTAIFRVMTCWPALRSLEVEAYVPKHMWPDADQIQQMQNLRRNGLVIRDCYRIPPGITDDATCSVEIMDHLIGYLRGGPLAFAGIRTVLSSIVPLLHNQEIFPCRAFSSIPPSRKAELIDLTSSELAVSRLPSDILDALRSLQNEWAAAKDTDMKDSQAIQREPEANIQS